MTAFNWQVVDMQRQTANNYVVTVHYRVDATDGDYTASTYGTVSYTEQPGETYIPYDDLTPEIVTGWVQDSLGKATVEASLQGQIDTQKNPPVVSGLPWSA